MWSQVEQQSRTTLLRYSAYSSSFIHSFIPDISIAPHQGSLFRGASDYSIDTESELTPKALHATIRVKDLPIVPPYLSTIEWDSNQRPSGRNAPNLPLSHHVSQICIRILNWMLFGIGSQWRVFA